MVQQSIRMVYCIPLRKRRPAAICMRKISSGLYLDSACNPETKPGRQRSAGDDLDRSRGIGGKCLSCTIGRIGTPLPEELNIAAAIQQGLMELPSPTCPTPGCMLEASPARSGGDFYDVIATSDGLYVVIADISGKGVSAAILASTLQGLLYGLLLAGQPLAQIADVANRYICEKNVQKYATMILVKLGPDGSFEYVNCGHVQPMLANSAGVKRLETPTWWWG